MPSCVMKSCSNHSGFMKKCQGITFHRFPKTNEVWRQDLINIIRECRGENNWLPTKSSVICSAHFDPNDLYTTKGGLLRVITYAVPKKCLPESPSIREKQPADPNISSVKEEFVVEPQNTEEIQPAEPNISNIKQESSSMIEAVNSSFEQPIKFENSVSPSLVLLPRLFEPPNMQEKQLAEPNISIVKQEPSPVIEAVTPSVQQPLKFEQSPPVPRSLVLPSFVVETPNMRDKQPAEPNISRVKQEGSSEIGVAASEVDTQQPLSIHYYTRYLYTPKERGLKETLMEKQMLIQKQKRKIKVLNQKIRRLQNRNKSLKDMLKNPKN